MNHRYHFRKYGFTGLLLGIFSMHSPAASASQYSVDGLIDSIGEAKAIIDKNRKLNKSLAPKVNLHRIIERAAKRYEVPAGVVALIIKIESDNFDACSLSKAGAEGVMQLMPQTSRLLSVTDPFNVEQNVMGGTKYLARRLVITNNNLSLAGALYNGGDNLLYKGRHKWPEETRGYLVKIGNYYSKFYGEGWKKETPVWIPDGSRYICSL